MELRDFVPSPKQGARRLEVMFAWTFDDRRDLESVLRMELPREIADPWLAAHPDRAHITHGHVLFSLTERTSALRGCADRDGGFRWVASIGRRPGTALVSYAQCMQYQRARRLRLPACFCADGAAPIGRGRWNSAQIAA